MHKLFFFLDLLSQDSHSLKQDLIQLVEESLKQVGKKLKIRPELIIPLENLIKVDDLERIVNEKDQIIQQLKDELQQLKDGYTGFLSLFSSV